MNPPRQQQQEFMRQQQEQLRRRMEMGHAWEQQQAEARKQASCFGRVPEDPFTRVEREVDELCLQYMTRRLTAEQVVARLRALRFQDGQGNWWMPGVASGEWYRFDGARWVPATPSRVQRFLATRF